MEYLDKGFLILKLCSLAQDIGGRTRTIGSGLFLLM